MGVCLLRHMSQISSHRSVLIEKALRILIALAQILSALGAAVAGTLKPPELAPLVGALETASAHNLTMQISFLTLDPAMSALLEQRALINSDVTRRASLAAPSQPPVKLF